MTGFLAGDPPSSRLAQGPENQESVADLLTGVHVGYPGSQLPSSNPGQLPAALLTRLLTGNPVLAALPRRWLARSLLLPPRTPYTPKRGASALRHPKPGAVRCWAPEWVYLACCTTVAVLRTGTPNAGISIPGDVRLLLRHSVLHVRVPCLTPRHRCYRTGTPVPGLASPVLCSTSYATVLPSYPTLY